MHAYHTGFPLGPYTAPCRGHLLGKFSLYPAARLMQMRGLSTTWQLLGYYGWVLDFSPDLKICLSTAAI